MVSPVELGVATVLALVVLWAVDGTQSFVTAPVDGRVDLLTWNDRMAELAAGRDDGAAEQDAGPAGGANGEATNDGCSDQ